MHEATNTCPANTRTRPRRKSAARQETRAGETALVPPMANGGAAVASEVGEESLLFLYPESALGFTAPVGLGQGKFLVRPSEGRDNLGDLVVEIRKILKK